ncbi:MAG: prephenate dehydrogenase [Dehalococcoidales bacterium]|nr:prephenate dehydrogenase [Dehalococcoidales bacterium]
MKRPMRVAIIGGSGKMGRWFANFLLQEGSEVVITGRNQDKLQAAQRELGVTVATNEEAVKKADVVILSVPIDSFAEIVRQIGLYTRPEQIIVDVTSVKVFPVTTMHQYIKNGLILGTHPVFGPGAKSVANHSFVLTPTSDQETNLAQKAKDYLEARGAKVTLMSPQEHDEMMAVILGLSHFIAIVAADTLLGLDRWQKMEAISGTTYKVLMTLVESVLSEDPELYASLQMYLPNVVEIERVFLERTKIWADWVKNRERQQFVDRMNALKSKLKTNSLDFGRAYENMYRIVEGL